LNFTLQVRVVLPAKVHDLDDSFPWPDEVNFTDPDGRPAPVVVPELSTVAVQVMERPAETEPGVHVTEVVVGCFQEIVTDAAAVVLDTDTPVALLLMKLRPAPPPPPPPVS
jgi:hypothetical protein